MSDAAFREALDAYISLVQWLRAWALNRDNTRPSEEEINAARARVLALYAERENDHLAALEQVALATIRMEQGRAERLGEERVRTVMYGEAVVLHGRDSDPTVFLWPNGDYRVFHDLKPGDRVRVVKCEAGE